MRLRTLAAATAVGLVATLAPAVAAEAAKKPAYKVSIKTSKTRADVHQTISIAGKVRGPKVAKKRLAVQLKVGAGGWRTVKKIRTTTSGRYSTKVSVTLAGQQYLRVVAPRSAKARAGVSPRRGFMGWRWLDMTTQRSYTEGTMTVEDVRIVRTTYPRALTFEGGRYFKVAGACDTFKTSVGVPDASGRDGYFAFLEYTRADLSDDPTETSEDLKLGVAPKSFRSAISGAQVIAFGGFGAAITPLAHCTVNALPTFSVPTR